MWGRVSVLLALAGALAAPAGAGALTLDPIGTFSSPVYVTSDPANAHRLFVVEKAGTIQLQEGDRRTTFLDLTAAPTPPGSTGERGLLSMAFADDFETSGHFYVFYTLGGTAGTAALGDLGDLQVDEYTASGDGASLSSRRPLLTIEHSSQTNHNGGQLQLGPDGYLYIATGDGGSGGDPDGNGQNLNSLLGKLLRIDPSQGSPYAVPPDNPFVGVAGADEIWSYGLRNPWRFSFDRLTGDLLIGDVGQGLREEVDYEPDDPNLAPSNAGRGDNFGWDCREGELAYTGPPGSPSAACPMTGFTEPVFTYAHPAGCSITGGYVVRDESLVELFGRYVLVDLCAGNVGSIVPALPTATDPRLDGISVSSPSSFGEDACGRIYIAELGDGAVSRVAGDEADGCPPAEFTLTVDVTGTGTGTVDGSGISCPGDCDEDLQEGDEVTLIATPAPGSTFGGWDGDCSGTSSCELVSNGDRSVSAEFGQPEPESPPTCAREEATILAQPGKVTVGTPGVDFIVGTSGQDEIRALQGNDAICGLGAGDRLRGGGGADTVKGGRGRDRLGGGAGTDHLAGGPGRDVCVGGPGRDTKRSC